MNEYQQKIESLLFYKNQPVSATWLSRHLGISISNTKDELNEMKDLYTDRGVQLVIVEDMISLVTHSQNNDLINSLHERDAAKELSKQALETLAIILFKERVTKAEIDFIRGVNSVYILRNLSVRGLIDKKINPQDKRSPLYIPTLDLLSFLGVTSINEIDSYDSFKEKLDETHLQFEKEQSQEDIDKEKDEVN